MYSYTIDVKKPVRNIMTMKMLPNPIMNDAISPLDLELRLKATKRGMIGRIHGDNIEIIPVKKDITGNISI